jgi:hypothetical protein
MQGDLHRTEVSRWDGIVIGTYLGADLRMRTLMGVGLRTRHGHQNKAGLIAVFPSL